MSEVLELIMLIQGLLIVMIVVLATFTYLKFYPLLFAWLSHKNIAHFFMGSRLEFHSNSHKIGR